VTVGSIPDAGGGGTGAVAHGSELTVSHVGPWTLQGVAKGSESLQTLTGPGRGYWRFDVPDEFLPTGTYVNDNSPSNHGGVVPGGGMTIDGYAVAAGTRVVQFCDFPDGYDFLGQGTSLKVLFRGCRFRWTTGVSGPGIVNDNTATTSQQVMVHYCDIGLQSMNPPNAGEALMHFKMLGGRDHRFLRNYHTRSSTFLQPNVDGCEITECYIDEAIFGYGESGTSGGFDSSVLHMNGISSEGGRTSMRILRNHICFPSPDGSTGGGTTAAGQIGYGTQTGQTGYGSGTAPGRLVTQTDCIALFTSNGSSNVGSSPGAILVQDNYLGGSGACLYAGNANAGAQNIHIIGNRWTTRWWTNGGNFGAVTDAPTWGSNGNAQSDNLWADDYGTGGNGCTATADRQYPTGNGPRVGASVI
jgi:hypothetical protein